MLRGLNVDTHFLNPCPKSHTEESPMKSKAQKDCQEDERAREVQRKKCKGNGFATEYKSAVEYSALAGWLWQTKTN